jgi:hypothetical protein
LSVVESARAQAALQRGCGQRIAVVLDGDAAEIARIEAEGVTEQCGDPLQRTHAFARDFRTDAIAGQYGDVRLHRAMRCS